MAQVPVLNTPQVEERALPGARQSSIASPELFGAQADQMTAAGRGLMVAGTGLGNAAAVMQERENADMVLRAETALKDEYLKFEQTVRSRRGMNAWGATTDAEKWFAEQGKTNSEILQNDKQRYLFGVSLNKLRQSSMGTIANYESDQRHRSLEESARGSIVGSINMAASAAADGLIVPSGENAGGVTVTKDADGNEVATAPGVTVGRNPITGIKKDIINRVQVLGELNGWSPERRQAEEAQHLTNLHKQVIQVLADKNPTAARQYLDANKAEINGSELDTIGKVLKIGETRGTAQAWVDRLDPAQDEGLALEAARIEFKDKPEIRDAVIAETKMRFNERRQLREAGQRDAADQAYKLAQEGGGMKAVPSSLVAEMDGKTVLSMQDYFANKAAGVETKTNPTTYYDLRRLSVDDPATFQRIDLKQYINALSPSDFQEFVKLQTNDNDRLESATQQQQLAQVHTQMKWGDSDGDKAKKGTFDKAVTDAIRTEQLTRGRKLTQEERQDVMDKMLINGEVDGSGFWSDSKRYYEATPEQREKFAPTGDDRKQVIDRFKKLKGYAPSEQEIVDTYKKWKGL